MVGAARHGHLAVVKLLHELRPEQCGCCLAARAVAAAAGHTEVARWLDERCVDQACKPHSSSGTWCVAESICGSFCLNVCRHMFSLSLAGTSFRFLHSDPELLRTLQEALETSSSSSSSSSSSTAAASAAAAVALMA